MSDRNGTRGELGNLPIRGERFDLLAVLDRCGIEHLEVSDERTIIIHKRTIFNCEVGEGHLREAQSLHIEVFDLAPDLSSSTDPMDFIEGGIGEIGTTAGVEVTDRAVL